ncbi:MAG: APC family permease, partial [Thermoplasmataceae archaeon]
LVAEIFLILIFLINMLRIKHMGNINSVLTIVTVVLIAVVLIGLAFSFNTSNLNNPSYGGIAPYGAAGLFTAITFTVFGYGGFRQPVDYSEEAKNPGKSIPLAIIISIVISAAIYALLAFVFVGAATPSLFGTNGAGNWASFYGSTSPYASEAQVLALPIIVVVAVIVALIATFKDGIIYYGGTARVGQTLAKEDKFFPRWLDKMTKSGVPVFSVILVFVVSLILVALGRSLATIIGFMVDAFLLSYAPGCVSLAVFRKTDPEVKRPFKLPAAKILAPIAWLVTTLMLYWSTFPVIELIVPLDLAGIVLLVFYARHNKVSLKSLGYGIWMPIFFLFILGYSYIGSSLFGGINIVPFPWDSVIFAVVALIFYYIAVESGVRHRRLSISAAKA